MTHAVSILQSFFCVSVCENATLYIQMVVMMVVVVVLVVLDHNAYDLMAVFLCTVWIVMFCWPVYVFGWCTKCEVLLRNYYYWSYYMYMYCSTEFAKLLTFSTQQIFNIQCTNTYRQFCSTSTSKHNYLLIVFG